MKYLTFAVPCYNSQEYMARCVDTLLTGGDRVEIILVDDGSVDNTGAIADRYAAEHPDIVKVIHQPNQGHGSGVNAGLDNATGLYYKVVDSDDWLDTGNLERLLDQLEQWHSARTRVDLVVCNYVYDHLNEGRKKSMGYRNVFPDGVICGWEDTGRFGPSQYLIMHALIFRTQLLRDSGVRLPSHTFYVDNLFAYKPLPLVETICYLDMDLYHYFLGREDQSVNESVLMRRIDQQIKVNKLVAESVDLKKVRSRKLARYMTRNVSIMTSISSIHLLLIGTPEALQKRRELWEYMDRLDPLLYKKLRYHCLSSFTYLPGALGRWATLAGYRLARRVVQFQ